MKYIFHKLNKFLLIVFINLYFFIDRKAHRNGIKKPKRYRHESTLGVSFILKCFIVPLYILKCFLFPILFNQIRII